MTGEGSSSLSVSRRIVPCARQLATLSYVYLCVSAYTGAYHRDTSCDQSTFIANQQQAQAQEGMPAATQVVEGAEGDEKDTEAYKMKRAQFSLQVQ